MLKNMRAIPRFLVGLVASLLAQAGMAQALDLAQEPLFLAAAAEPNIMFILDDSGSMQFEVMPEEEFIISYRSGYWNTTQYTMYYVFPRVASVYGNGTYNAYVPTVDDNVFNYRARSPQVNTLYYNPAVTYAPWTKSDGSLYPNADPQAAYHHPENTGSGYRNLTVDNSNTYTGHPWINSTLTYWFSCTSLTSCQITNNSKTFWPATYYWYDGDDKWDKDDYTKVEIKSGVATYTGHGRENRTDCAAANSCTYSEEIQNFANWYTYYRSRTLAARAGVGKAFAQQGEGMRVGYGAINKSSSDVDGINTGTIVRGVRTFSGDDRDRFFELLYKSEVPAAGTPLRRALDEAGQYFSRTDNKGPWGSEPGVDNNTSHLQCRQSYTVLMTDGYWSGNSARTNGATKNNDNLAGNKISGPDGQEYTFAAGTAPFADSHSDTLADVAMYYWKNDLRADLENRVPTSTINPAFWQHMVTFGVGLGVFGSVDPDDAFNAIETQTSIAWPNPTAGNPEKIDDLLHASVNGRGGFFSAADPETFASELSGVLQNIVDRVTGSAASVAANSTRLGTDTSVFQARFDSTKWSGEIQAWQLDEDDGSIIDPMKWTTKGKIKAAEHAGRRVFTYNGTNGLEFNESNWNSLTTGQRNALKGDGDDALGKKRLNWVRGKNDIAGLRVRDEILGDIVNSSPVFSGRRSFNFERIKEAEGAASYEAFVQARRNRKEVLYVGANDGMVHAFEADTGEELFAYVPSGVYSQLRKLSQPDYGRSSNPHVYSVDGPLFVGDAYYNGRWRTLLVGGLGAGGRGFFVLDVTDPGSFGAGDVLFELTADDVGWGDELGNVMGQPVIAPMANGNWAIVFGNGYNSSGGKAALFVVELNPSSAAFNVITLSPSDDQSNGLAEPALVTHGGGLVTAAYAGDLFGNMWKFDLSSSNNTNQWKPAYGGAPLFVAKDDSGNRQPITAAPVLGSNKLVPDSIMVYFGTGRYLSRNDNSVGDTIQSFYALADTGAAITYPGNRRRDVLYEKTIASESSVARQIGGNHETSFWESRKGWYLDFEPPSGAGVGERVVSKPLLMYDRLIFPTIITSDDPCASGASGWLMELVAVGGLYDNYSFLGVDGRPLDAAVMGLSGIMKSGSTGYLPTNNIEGELSIDEGDLPADAVGRMSWRQLR